MPDNYILERDTNKGVEYAFQVNGKIYPLAGRPTFRKVRGRMEYSLGKEWTPVNFDIEVPKSFMLPDALQSSSPLDRLEDLVFNESSRTAYNKRKKEISDARLLEEEPKTAEDFGMLKDRLTEQREKTIWGEANKMRSMAEAGAAPANPKEDEEEYRKGVKGLDEQIDYATTKILEKIGAKADNAFVKYGKDFYKSQDYFADLENIGLEAAKLADKTTSSQYQLQPTSYSRMMMKNLGMKAVMAARDAKMAGIVDGLTQSGRYAELEQINKFLGTGNVEHLLSVEQGIRDEVLEYAKLQKAAHEITWSDKEYRKGLLSKAVLNAMANRYKTGGLTGINGWDTDMLRDVIEDFKDAAKKGGETSATDSRDIALLNEIGAEGIAQIQYYKHFASLPENLVMNPYNQNWLAGAAKMAGKTLYDMGSFAAKAISDQVQYGTPTIPGAAINSIGRMQESILEKDEDQMRPGIDWRPDITKFNLDRYVNVDTKDKSFLQEVENKGEIGGFTLDNILYNSAGFAGQLAAQALVGYVVPGGGFFGKVAVPAYAMSFDNNLKSSFDVIGTESPIKNYLYAAIMSAGEGLSEKFGNPLEQASFLGSAFAKEGLASALRNLSERQLRSMTRGELKSYLREAIITGSKESAQKAGKEIRKEMLFNAKERAKNLARGVGEGVLQMAGESNEEASLQLVNNIVDDLFTGGKAHNYNVVEGVGDVWLETFASMAFSGAGGVAKGVSADSRLTQQAIYTISKDPHAAAQAILKQYQEGKLSQEQYTEKLRMVNLLEDARKDVHRYNVDQYVAQRGGEQKFMGTENQPSEQKGDDFTSYNTASLKPRPVADNVLAFATAMRAVEIDATNKIEAEKQKSAPDESYIAQLEERRDAHQVWRDASLRGDIAINPVTGAPAVAPVPDLDTILESIYGAKIDDTEETESEPIAPPLFDVSHDAEAIARAVNAESEQQRLDEAAANLKKEAERLQELANQKDEGVATKARQRIEQINGEIADIEQKKAQLGPTVDELKEADFERERRDMYEKPDAPTAAERVRQHMERRAQYREKREGQLKKSRMAEKKKVLEKRRLEAMEKEAEEQEEEKKTWAETQEERKARLLQLQGYRNNKRELDTWLDEKNKELRALWTRMPYDEWKKMYDEVLDTYKKELDVIRQDAQSGLPIDPWRKRIGDTYSYNNYTGVLRQRESDGMYYLEGDDFEYELDVDPSNYDLKKVKKPLPKKIKKPQDISVVDENTAIVDGKEYTIVTDDIGAVIRLKGVKDIRDTKTLTAVEIERNKLPIDVVNRRQPEAEPETDVPEFNPDTKALVDSILGQALTDEVAALLDNGVTTEADFDKVNAFVEKASQLIKDLPQDEYTEAVLESLDDLLDIALDQYDARQKTKQNEQKTAERANPELDPQQGDAEATEEEEAEAEVLTTEEMEAQVKEKGDELLDAMMSGDLALVDSLKSEIDALKIKIYEQKNQTPGQRDEDVVAQGEVAEAIADSSIEEEDVNAAEGFPESGIITQDDAKRFLGKPIGTLSSFIEAAHVMAAIYPELAPIMERAIAVEQRLAEAFSGIRRNPRVPYVGALAEMAKGGPAGGAGLAPYIQRMYNRWVYRFKEEGERSSELADFTNHVIVSEEQLSQISNEDIKASRERFFADEAAHELRVAQEIEARREQFQNVEKENADIIAAFPGIASGIAGRIMEGKATREDIISLVNILRKISHSGVDIPNGAREFWIMLDGLGPDITVESVIAKMKSAEYDDLFTAHKVRAIIDAVSELKNVDIKQIDAVPRLKPTTKPSEPTDSDITEDTKTVRIRLSAINLDEESFQNRDKLNETTLDYLVKNWSDNEQEPVIVWKDENGKMWLISGHHRYEAASRLKLDDIRAMLFESSREEAIKYATERSNAARTQETDLERAKIYRKKREAGVPADEVVAEAKKLERNNATYIIDLSYLNPKGKTADAIRILGEVEHNKDNTEVLLNAAQWIGAARRMFPELTDVHEDELYDLLLFSTYKKRVTRKADFFKDISKKVRGGVFDENAPLDLTGEKAKKKEKSQYQQEKERLENEISSRRDLITQITDRFTNPQSAEFIPLDDPMRTEMQVEADKKIANLRTEIDLLVKQYTSHLANSPREQAAGQPDLFSAAPKEIQEIDKAIQEVDEAIDEVVSAIDAINERLSLLTTVFSTQGIAHENPNKEIAKRAAKEIKKFMNFVARQYGWIVDDVRPNIAPAGGEISVSLTTPTGPVRISFRYEPEYTTHYDNYRLFEFFVSRGKINNRYPIQDASVAFDSLAQAIAEKMAENAKELEKKSDPPTQEGDKQKRLGPDKVSKGLDESSLKEVQDLLNKMLRQNMATFMEPAPEDAERRKTAVMMMGILFKQGITDFSKIISLVYELRGIAAAYDLFDTIQSEYIKLHETLGDRFPMTPIIEVENLSPENIFYDKPRESTTDANRGEGADVYGGAGADGVQVPGLDEGESAGGVQPGDNNRNVGQVDGAERGGVSGGGVVSGETGAAEGTSARGGAGGVLRDLKDSGASVTEDVTETGYNNPTEADDTEVVPLPEKTNVGHGTIRNPIPDDFAFPEDHSHARTFNVRKRLEANLAALRVLRDLIGASNNATPEQQAILAQYVGWGGLKGIVDVFAGQETENAELYFQAIALMNEIGRQLQVANVVEKFVLPSIADSFYTPLSVIRGAWYAMQKMGVAGGSVVDISAGIGNWFGAAPTNMLNSITKTAVEIDPITAAIASLLYPSANVMPFAYQSVMFDQQFQVGVTNVPFGQTTIPTDDPFFRSLGKDIKIHNFFVAAQIKALEPGGVAAIVVTSRMLDKDAGTIGDFLMEKTRIIGAVRLPDSTFQGSSNTSVTTDLIFVQRPFNDGSQWHTNRANGFDMYNTESQAATHRTTGETETVVINMHFANHPEDVLGTIQAGSMYTGEADGSSIVAATEEYRADPEAAIKAWVDSRIPADIVHIAAIERTREKTEANRVEGIENPKVGYIYEQGGQLYYADGFDSVGKANLREIKVGNKQSRPKGMTQLAGVSVYEHKGDVYIEDNRIASFRAYIKLREAFMDLVASEKIEPDGPELDAKRKKARSLYNKFVAEHGNINASKNKHLQFDNGYFFISALEIDGQDSNGKKILRPAKILTERANRPWTPPTSAETFDEAVAISFNVKGTLDLPFIAFLLGKSVESVFNENKGGIFELPTGGFELAADYLSGRVREKLKEAEKAAQINPKYQRNVAELQNVVPRDKTLAEIPINPGAPYIPAFVFEQFLTQIAGEKVSVTYSRGQYNVVRENKNGSAMLHDVRLASGVALEGISDSFTLWLMEAFLADVPVSAKAYSKGAQGEKIYLPKVSAEVNDFANAKLDEWRTRLPDYVRGMSPDTISRIADQYNDAFNGTIPQKYDGGMLTFPTYLGQPMYKHQKDAVFMILRRMGGVVDHIVGAGKTKVLVAAALEAKRLGLARKPMIAALKANAMDIANEAMSSFPGAKILYVKESDFTKASRQRLLASIATEDWDLVVLTHNNVTAIPADPQTERAIIDAEIAELTQAMGGTISPRQKKSFTARVKKLAERREKIRTKADNVFDFATIGVDMLLVDESHQFKNLAYSTELESVSGLNTAVGSQRASALLAHIRHIQKLRGGDKGVVFASGTTISNSVMEVYSLLNYLQPELLDQMGIHTFDLFRRAFVNIATDFEVNTAGLPAPKTRLRGLVNAQELSLIYRMIAHVVNDGNLKLPKPKSVRTFIKVPQTEQQAYLTMRFQNLAKTKSGKNVDRRHQVKEMTDGHIKAFMLMMAHWNKMLALDPRLLDSRLEGGNKIPYAADKVKELYDKWDSINGAIAVFCDTGTPKPKGLPQHMMWATFLQDTGFGGFKQDDIEEITGASYDPQTGTYSTPTRSTEEVLAKIEEIEGVDVRDAAANAFEEYNKSEFNVYDEFKREAIQRGIPEDQIVFIHDYPTAIARAELFKKINAGEIRVVLGSTEKLGTGVNIQKRLVGAVHLDIKYRPSDDAQRNGRSVRQGNMLYELGEPVELFYMGVENSLDAFMYNVNGVKEKFITQFQTGNLGNEVEYDGAEDEQPSFLEYMAETSGDRSILDLAGKQKELSKLQNERTATENIAAQGRHDFERFTNLLAVKKQQMEAGEKIAKENKVEWEKVVYNFDGEEIEINDENKSIIDNRLRTEIERVRIAKQTRTIATINGFQVIAVPSTSGKYTVSLYVKAPIAEEPFDERREFKVSSIADLNMLRTATSAAKALAKKLGLDTGDFANSDAGESLVRSIKYAEGKIQQAEENSRVKFEKNDQINAVRQGIAELEKRVGGMLAENRMPGVNRIPMQRASQWPPEARQYYLFSLRESMVNYPSNAWGVFSEAPDMPRSVESPRFMTPSDTLALERLDDLQSEYANFLRENLMPGTSAGLPKMSDLIQESEDGDEWTVDGQSYYEKGEAEMAARFLIDKMLAEPSAEHWPVIPKEKPSQEDILNYAKAHNKRKDLFSLYGKSEVPVMVRYIHYDPETIKKVRKKAEELEREKALSPGRTSLTGIMGDGKRSKLPGFSWLTGKNNDRRFMVIDANTVDEFSPATIDDAKRFIDAAFVAAENEDEIKAVYRRLSMKFHPDTSTIADEMKHLAMQHLNGARDKAMKDAKNPKEKAKKAANERSRRSYNKEQKENTDYGYDPGRRYGGNVRGNRYGAEERYANEDRRAWFQKAYKRAIAEARTQLMNEMGKAGLWSRFRWFWYIKVREASTMDDLGKMADMTLRKVMGRKISLETYVREMAEIIALAEYIDPSMKYRFWHADNVKKANEYIVRKTNDSQPGQRFSSKRQQISNERAAQLGISEIKDRNAAEYLFSKAIEKKRLRPGDIDSIGDKAWTMAHESLTMPFYGMAVKQAPSFGMQTKFNFEAYKRMVMDMRRRGVLNIPNVEPHMADDYARHIANASKDDVQRMEKEILEVNNKERLRVFEEWISYLNLGQYDPVFKLMVLNEVMPFDVRKNQHGEYAVLKLDKSSNWIPAPPYPPAIGDLYHLWMTQTEFTPHLAYYEAKNKTVLAKVSDNREKWVEYNTMDMTDEERRAWAKEFAPYLAGSDSWCIQNETTLASSAERGNFHFYFNNEGIVSLGAHIDRNDRVIEFRGIGHLQEMMPGDEDIVIGYSQMKGFLGAKQLLAKMEGRKRLAEIDDAIGRGENVRTSDIKAAIEDGQEIAYINYTEGIEAKTMPTSGSERLAVGFRGQEYYPNLLAYFAKPLTQLMKRAVANDETFIYSPQLLVKKIGGITALGTTKDPTLNTTMLAKAANDAGLYYATKEGSRDTITAPGKYFGGGKFLASASGSEIIVEAITREDIEMGEGDFSITVNTEKGDGKVYIKGGNIVNINVQGDGKVEVRSLGGKTINTIGVDDINASGATENITFDKLDRLSVITGEVRGEYVHVAIVEARGPSVNMNIDKVDTLYVTTGRIPSQLDTPAPVSPITFTTKNDISVGRLDHAHAPIPLTIKGAPTINLGESIPSLETDATRVVITSQHIINGVIYGERSDLALVAVREVDDYGDPVYMGYYNNRYGTIEEINEDAHFLVDRRKLLQKVSITRTSSDGVYFRLNDVVRGGLVDAGDETARVSMLFGDNKQDNRTLFEAIKDFAKASGFSAIAFELDVSDGVFASESKTFRNASESKAFRKFHESMGGVDYRKFYREGSLVYLGLYDYQIASTDTVQPTIPSQLLQIEDQQELRKRLEELGYDVDYDFDGQITRIKKKYDALASVAMSRIFLKTTVTPRYAAKPKSQRAIPIDQARALAEEAKAAAMEEFGEEVIILDSLADLDPNADMGAAFVPAVYEAGKVYLFLDGIAALEKSEPGIAMRSMMHEIVGHKGIGAILGDTQNDVFEMAYRAMPPSERSRLARDYAPQLATMTTKERIRLIGEEYIALLAEGRIENPSLLAKIITAIKIRLAPLLNKLGIGITDGDIRTMLYRSKTEVRKRKESAQNALRMLIIGEKGAQNMPIVRENLAIAKEMEAAGKDSNTIFLATGWQRDTADKNQWKYDLIEGDISINPALAKRDNPSFLKTRLGDVMRSGPIFDAYPQLRDYNLWIFKGDPPSGARGSFEQETKTIRLFGVPYTSTMAEHALRRSSVLAHEIQHAIQAIEGFAKGGNSTMFTEDSLPSNPDLETYNSEKNQANIARLNELKQMPGFNEQVDDGERYYNEVVKPKLSIAKFGEEKLAVWESFSNYMRKNNPLAHEYSELSYHTIINRPQEKVDAYEAYTWIAGEVEARNVQKRLNWDAQKRRSTPLVDTEDVAPEFKIFFYHDPVSEQMQSSVSKRRYTARGASGAMTASQQRDYDEARKLEKGGADPAYIKAKTGWEKWLDNLWRFEIGPISINHAMWRDLPYSSDNPQVTPVGMPLSAVVQHPEMYKAYPTMKNMQVFKIKGFLPRFDEGQLMPNTTVAYAAGDRIYISEKMVRATGQTLEEVMEHEVTHLIQAIEGWASGGSAELMAKVFHKELSEIAIRNIQSSGNNTKDLDALTSGNYNKKYLKAIVDNAGAEAFSYYYWLAGEVEARNFTTRRGFTSRQRRQMLLSSTAQRPPKGTSIRVLMPDEIITLPLDEVSDIDTDPYQRLMASKKRVKDAWAAMSHVGAIYDPQREAKKQLELYLALYNLAKDAIRAGVVSLHTFITEAAKDLADELGVDPYVARDNKAFINSARKAWQDASRKTSENADAIYEKLKDNDKALADFIGSLIKALNAAKKNQETITVGRTEIPVRDAWQYVQYLQRRKTPDPVYDYNQPEPVKSRPGTMRGLTDVQFSTIIRERLRLITKTELQSYRAFLEAVQQHARVTVEGTYREREVKDAWDQANIMRNTEVGAQKAGTTRTIGNLLLTEELGFSGSFIDSARKLLHYNRLGMKDDISNILSEFDDVFNDEAAIDNASEILSMLDEYISSARTDRGAMPFLHVYQVAKANFLRKLLDAGMSNYEAPLASLLSEIVYDSQMEGRRIVSFNFIYEHLGRLGALGRDLFAERMIQREEDNAIAKLQAVVNNIEKTNKKMRAEIRKKMNEVAGGILSDKKLINDLRKEIDKICKKYT